MVPPNEKEEGEGKEKGAVIVLGAASPLVASACGDTEEEAGEVVVPPNEKEEGEGKEKGAAIVLGAASPLVASACRDTEEEAGEVVVPLAMTSFISSIVFDIAIDN